VVIWNSYNGQIGIIWYTYIVRFYIGQNDFLITFRLIVYYFLLATYLYYEPIHTVIREVRIVVLTYELIIIIIYDAYKI